MKCVQKDLCKNAYIGFIHDSQKVTNNPNTH